MLQKASYWQTAHSRTYRHNKWTTHSAS